jgi:transcriptional regulator with XRE-family HTH domain
MDSISSMALPESQALLHCGDKALLYNVDMTLGKRIARARKRLSLTQQALADGFGISDKAVSSWERDETTPDPAKMPMLRKHLRVTYKWLYEGPGDPPPPDSPQVALDDLEPAEADAVAAFLIHLRTQRRNNVA